MKSALRLALALGMLLSGCANVPVETQADRVVLLPGAGGKVGRLAVTSTGGATVLDSAYGAAAVSTAGNVARAEADAASVQRDFGAALAALPPRPVSHTLYFESEQNHLTPESEADARATLMEIAARPVADILLVGHTDTAGTEAFNDALSIERATVVRDLLVQLGGAAGRIKITGRGERELAVQTPDETHEARNRRVEMIVR